MGGASRVRSALVVGCMSFIGVAEGQTPNRTPADLVLFNGRLWTGAATKGDAAEPTALAIKGDTIVAVGTDAEILPRVGPATQAIDVSGKRIIPGITDSHTHLISGGFSLARLNLRQVRDREEFIHAVAEAAKTKRKGEWVLGGRWSVESWAKPEPPHRGWLDPVTSEVPVFLNRMDGHSALANTAALKLAGIDAQGPSDPVGGEIERDRTTHEPTGILKDAAMDWVSKLIPKPTLEDRVEALKRAVQHAHSFGLTSIHDMSDPADLEAFGKAVREGTLTLRITSYVQVDDWHGHLEDVRASSLSTADGKVFRVAGLKGYMDGSMGSRTAYMHEPYADLPPTAVNPRGQLTAFASSTGFAEQVWEADAAGLQLAVHAIGDEAIHLLLDAYAGASEKNRRKRPLHRVEHAQHLSVSDVSRFAELGVAASMQPLHKADDGRYVEKVLGRERMRGSYAFRELLDSGAMLIFGSDWPVVPLNPFAGIDSAVNAKTLSGEVWLPEHSITVEEAIRAYTVTPCKVIHADQRIGTIEVQKLADLVVLAEDPFTMPKERLGEVKVWRTIVGGRVVYTAP